MGISFKRSIESKYKDKIDCHPVIATFPTVTRFGMAAHLDDISICVEGNELQPMLGDKVVKLPDQRIAYLRERTGVEVQDMRLDEFNAAAINDSTQLLVIRSLTIDSSGEHDKMNALPTMESELRKLARAVEACRQKGFDLMVIVADHGFMLLPSFRQGDWIEKPVGSDIVLQESRVIAGNLNDSKDTLSFTPEELGIKAPVMKLCYAKNFTSFVKNELYYHEGLSLQENVVPQITIRLQEEKKQQDYKVVLAYKGNTSGTFYSRRLLVDINTTFPDLFADDVHIIMPVTDEHGNQIGRPEGRAYNELTEQLDITAGYPQFRQPISIDDDFNGGIVVIKALDASTHATLSEIKLNFENEL